MMLVDNIQHCNNSSPEKQLDNGHWYTSRLFIFHQITIIVFILDLWNNHTILIWRFSSQQPWILNGALVMHCMVGCYGNMVYLHAIFLSYFSRGFFGFQVLVPNKRGGRVHQLVRLPSGL